MMLDRKSVAHTLLEKETIKPKEEIPSRFICCICNRILKNPRQSICGCRFCLTCISSYIEEPSNICPGSSEECKETVLSIKENIVNDFATYRDIANMTFVCTNENCNFEDQLKNIESHINSCPRSKINCELCNQLVIRNCMDEHVKNSCIERLVNCDYCETRFTFNQYKTFHINPKSENVCKNLMGQCPYKCSSTIQVNIADHRKVCENQPRNCPYSLLGCPIKEMAKKKIIEHLNTNSLMHAELNVLKIDLLEKHVKNMNKDLEKLKTKVRNYELMNYFVWKIEDFYNFKSKYETKQHVTLYSKTQQYGRYGYSYSLKMEILRGSIGVYFRIMRGDYDSILNWPVKGSVTLSLLHPQQIGKSLKKSFKMPYLETDSFDARLSSENIENVHPEDGKKVISMDVDGSNENESKIIDPLHHFIKPISKKNEAIGFRNFISLEELVNDGFIDADANNSIFFRCKITP